MQTIFFAADRGKVSITSITLILGTLFAIIGLVARIGVFKRYPLSLGLIVLAVFPPYVLYDPFGYVPRFSVHLLPLTSISVALTG